MWIRTQSNNRLCEAYGDIYIEKFDGEEVSWAIIRLDRRTVTDKETNDSGTILGEYDTEARALEVLDEIQQEILKSNYIPSKPTISDILGTNQITIYNMPQE